MIKTVRNIYGEKNGIDTYWYCKYQMANKQYGLLLALSNYYLQKSNSYVLIDPDEFMDIMKDYD